MLDTVRAWLNGNREYNMGVGVYLAAGGEKTLHAQFKKGFTLYNNWRLQEEMLKICADLKLKGTENNPHKAAAGKPVEPHEKIQILEKLADTAQAIINKVTNINPELHWVCIDQAKRTYKEAMNKRAVLFNGIPSEKYSDYNRADLVESRRKISLDVVKLFNQASQQFDDAEHVRLYGKLPYEPVDQPEENYSDIPDHRVMQELSNARKNLNKTGKKEITPQRIATIKVLEHKIKVLSDRWQSLK